MNNNKSNEDCSYHNPLNQDFWVDAEYGGGQLRDLASAALTATYGAIGVAHLIERSVSEMHLAQHCEHEYGGLKPTLLENMLCAQHALLGIACHRIEQLVGNDQFPQRPKASRHD